MCRELVQIIMATVREVGLQNFPKQTSFQQVVGHGQKLLDNLVEILREIRNVLIKAFLITNIKCCGCGTFRPSHSLKHRFQNNVAYTF